MKTTTLLLFLSSVAFAAPSGPGGVVPPAAPEDALYANNLVGSPGFERGGLAEKKEKRKYEPKTWYGSFENGMDAKFESAAPNKPVKPFEGHKALRIYVKDPAKYAKKALLGDWGEFEKGANGGKGAPRATLIQQVPVTPGVGYALRFRWRASGLYNDPLPGPDRGIVFATFACGWFDADDKAVPSVSQIVPTVFKPFAEDAEEWTTAAFPDYSGEKLPWSKEMNVPFVAPQGAAFLRLTFTFACRRPKVRPEIWLDQVEVVAIPDDAPLPNAAPAKPAAPAAAPAAPAKPAAPAATPAPPAEPAKPAPPAPPVLATTAKDGGVLKLDECGAEFFPALYLAGWAGAAKLETPVPAMAATSFVYRAGDVPIRGVATRGPAPDGSLRSSWAFTPEENVELAALAIDLRLPAAGFAGGSVRLDGADVALPAEASAQSSLFAGPVSSVAVRDATGRERFSFAFDAPTRISLQDNRVWKNDQFSLRIPAPSSSPFHAGVEQAFSLSLRGGAPASPER